MTTIQKTKQRLQQNGLITTMLALFLILANLRASIFWPLFPTTDSIIGTAWIEIIFWIAAAFMLFMVLIRGTSLDSYAREWEKNWIVAPFIALCIFSIAWSIDLPASSYRTLLLIFTSLAAVYIGMRHDIEYILRVLFWFGAIASIITIALILVWPGIAIQSGSPYYGAWRGIFWHRNHLGSVFALLNIVFLIGAVSAIQKRSNETYLNFFFYILSLVIVIFSRSATGYILLIALHSALALGCGWLKYRKQLRLFHYLSLLLVGIVLLIILLTNLDPVLSLVGRDSSLTGRLPLWKHLLAEVASKHLWLGHGFGAFWALGENRTSIQAVVGWPFPVFIGDNGFIDIFLHVGIVGSVLFAAILIIALVRAFRFAFRCNSLLDLFPTLFLIYAVMANISFSMFLETETFVWLILVAILVATAPAPDGSAKIISRLDQ